MDGNGCVPAFLSFSYSIAPVQLIAMEFLEKLINFCLLAVCQQTAFRAIQAKWVFVGIAEWHARHRKVKLK